MHWQRRFLGTGRGELKINEVVAALVRDLAVPVSKVVKRVEAHHQASLISNLKRFRGQVQEHRDGRTPLVRAETSLLLARCPFPRTPLGFSWWCLSSVQVPELRFRAAMDQGPRPTLRCTYGVFPARRPPMDENFQPRTCRSLCCTVYAVTCMPCTDGM